MGDRINIYIYIYLFGGVQTVAIGSQHYCGADTKCKLTYNNG